MTLIILFILGIFPTFSLVTHSLHYNLNTVSMQIHCDYIIDIIYHIP